MSAVRLRRLIRYRHFAQHHLPPLSGVSPPPSGTPPWVGRRCRWGSSRPLPTPDLAASGGCGSPSGYRGRPVPTPGAAVPRGSPPRPACTERSAGSRTLLLSLSQCVTIPDYKEVRSLGPARFSVSDEICEFTNSKPDNLLQMTHLIAHALAQVGFRRPRPRPQPPGRRHAMRAGSYRPAASAERCCPRPHVGRTWRTSRQLF